MGTIEEMVDGKHLANLDAWQRELLRCRAVIHRISKHTKASGHDKLSFELLKISTIIGEVCSTSVPEAAAKLKPTKS